MSDLEETEANKTKKSNIEGNKTNYKKIMMTTSKTKTKIGSSSDSSHASPTIVSPTGMPQGSGHVHSWRYTVYGSPPYCYHRGYIVVSPYQSPRPYENLQRAENSPDQQVQDGCPEEVISIHLLDA